jgi:DNA-directed RNA polymerase specialized sigma24 family protein
VLTPETLKTAMRIVPPQDAEILWDVYHHGMTMHDVARRRQLPLRQVGTACSRALRLLRLHVKLTKPTGRADI